MVFIDSNIPMYVAGRDHPLRAPALRLLAREVYDLFAALGPVVLPVTLADTDRAKDLLDPARGISVRDAVHAAIMLNNGVEEIASFDSGFDLVPGVRRVTLS